MNKLIYNEVYKILHKKTTLVFALFVIIQFIFVLIMAKVNNYYYNSQDRFAVEYARERTKTINEDKVSEITNMDSYIDDMNTIESYKYYRKYGNTSWQRYIFDEEASQYISCMNTNKYKTQDNEAYKKCKKDLNDIINKIDTKDWKYFVNNYYEDALKELKELQDSYNKETNEFTRNSIALSMKALQLEIDGYKYHIINNIPIDYSPNSIMISDYVSNATEYISTELDESKYKEYYLLLEKRKLEKSIFEDKYRLDNNLDSIGNNTAIAVFINNTCTAIIMLIIYMLMISGSIVSEEFNKGTIKQLLVRPYSRKKIIISKFLSTLIVSLLFLLFYILVCFIFCGITYGFKSYLTPIVIYNFTTKSVTEMSLLKYLLINTITYIPEYLILIALSFFLGTFILNEALAIGIPVMVLLVSSLVLEYTGLRFLKYFPTICWNFNDFLWGGLPTFEGLTLIVNIIVCLITFIILFMGSISVFKNKDIKNQ